MAVVASSVFLASLAAGGAAYAAGASYGWDYYYAQTGFDNVIYCAAGAASISWPLTGAPTDYVGANSWTQTRRDAYCANAQTAPDGYIKTKVSIMRGGSICVITGWAENPYGSHIADQGMTTSISACGGAGSYRAFAEHNAALNFGWQYDNGYTDYIQAG